MNPSALLDWRRFCSDSWLACFEEQRALLRAITPEIPSTTNFMVGHKPLDYFKWAAREDIVALDAYPDTSDPDWMIGSAMAYDLVRSLRPGQPWLLMEQASAAVNWRVRNVTKRPGVMRLGSYQALARGANGIMFFQWRASRFGAEKFHSGMVPHGGTETRTWREIKALGAELQGLAGVLDARVEAPVAILFDWENWWALEEDAKPLNDLHLLTQVRCYYAELYRRGIAVDFVHPEADLARYQLVLAPHLYLMTDRTAANLKQYVANGGVLLLSFFSGIVDERDHVRPGGYLASLQDVFGITIEEFAPYGTAKQTNAIITADGQPFACGQWSDVIRLRDAESLAAYQHDYYAGAPAITRNRFGHGAGYYVGTQPDAAGVRWLLNRLGAEAGLPVAPTLPAGVELVERKTSTHTWLFALNYSDQPVEVALGRPGQDLITGQAVEQSITLQPTDLAIIRSALA